MNKKKIIITDECIDFDVKDKEDCVNAIIEEYNRNDLCVEELLYSIEIQGFSVQDVVEIFARIINIIESDKLLQYKEESVRPIDRNCW